MDITSDDAGLELVLDGTARDLATDRARRAHVIATARSRVTVDVASGRVTGIEVSPDQHGRTTPLVGLPSGSGFRRALRRELPDLTADGSLLGLLLDEVPVAVVIAGSLLRRRPADTTHDAAADDAGSLVHRPDRPAARPLRPSPAVDICAGWARGGLLARTVEETGKPPLSEGPEVPSLRFPDDPDAWHPLAAMPVWSMRRARLIDVVLPQEPGGAFELDSMFRDSRLTGDDGHERGVHEYAVSGTVDGDGIITAMAATPRILPAPECPAAALSAQRLVGMRLGDLRAHVAASFTGTSTCTHLNDALRALGDLEALIAGGHVAAEGVWRG